MRGPRSRQALLPSLTAARTQYAPGTLAVFTGTGYLPSESVQMVVRLADGAPLGSDHDFWNATADASGRFTTSWLVSEDQGVGSMLTATAHGAASGTFAGTSFLNANDCGTGVVSAVTPVGGSCSAFTPAQGNGPDNYEVEEGGTYTMTITGVTECTGDTITIFVQSSESGNFCFDAVGGSGTYSGTFTIPNPACNTMPVNYKCGSNANCTNPGSLGAQGPTSGCGGVHLRASNFDANCNRTGTDEDCEAPPATGACCLADGSCVEVTADECAAQGGTYNGDGSSCGSVTCDFPAGACCLTDGSCVEETTEEGCAALGGTFNGDGSTCANVVCDVPTGACCLTDEECAQVTEEACAALNGVYFGDGSSCGSLDCDDSFPDCYVLGFDTDDDGNAMPHGAMVDLEYDCNGGVYPLSITGAVDVSGGNTAAILNSTTGPAASDPDLLVGKGNILILQTDGNVSQCPPSSGVYCSHNDDADGGTLTFSFCAPAIPSSITLVDQDGSDPLGSSVVLTDVNGKTRTYAIPGNWTGDKVANFPQPGWKVLNLTTLANQPGFVTTATASEQAGYDPNSVVSLVVTLGGSGGIDDLTWCQ